MLRLFFKPAIVLMVMLSLFPQLSAEFEEEQQGVQAAYDKAARAYNGTVHAYGETRKEIEVIKSRMTETKQDIDKSVAYANDKSAETSKYVKELKTFTDEAKNIVGTVRSEIDDGTGASAGSKVSLEPNK